MDYNRPDNINDALDKSLIKDLDRSGRGLWFYIFILIILFILGLVFYYFFFYKKINLSNIIPKYNAGLATSTPIIKTPVNISSTTDSVKISTGSVSTTLPGINKLFYIIWPEAITGYTYVGDDIIFQDKVTGHIYKASSPDYMPYKIANTTINNIYLSQFGNNGKTIVFQTLNSNNNTLSTYIADIADYNDKPSNLYNKAYLGDNIADFKSSPNGSNLAYISNDNKNYISNIYILNYIDRVIKPISSYPLPHIYIDYYSTNSLSIHTAPSTEQDNQVYTINLKSNILNLFMKGQRLLAKPTPAISAGGVIYSNKSGLYIELGKTTSKASFNTFTDHCVWAHSNAFILCGVDANYNSDNLDSYYKNSYNTNDKLYMFGVDYPEDKMIYDFESYNKQQVHVYNMSLTKNNNLLIMDKVKGLYLLKVNDVLTAENN